MSDIEKIIEICDGYCYPLDGILEIRDLAKQIKIRDKALAKQIKIRDKQIEFLIDEMISDRVKGFSYNDDEHLDKLKRLISINNDK